MTSGLALGTAIVVVFSLIFYSLYGAALEAQITINLAPHAPLTVAAIIPLVTRFYTCVPLLVTPLVRPVEDEVTARLAPRHPVRNRVALRSAALLATLAVSTLVEVGRIIVVPRHRARHRSSAPRAL